MTNNASVQAEPMDKPKPSRQFMSQEDRGKQCQAVIDLIEEGLSEAAACREVGINQDTFRAQVMKHVSSSDYARAMAALAHHQVVKLEHVISDMRSGVIDAAQARVESDNRKWVASKFLPKQYGDKLVTELTGKDGGAVQVEAVDPLAIIEQKLAKLIAANKPKE